MTGRRIASPRFRGQRQLWFAMRFTGDESEIDITRSRRRRARRVLRMALGAARAAARLVVAFKRDIYRAVAAQFAPFAAAPA